MKNNILLYILAFLFLNKTSAQVIVNVTVDQAGTTIGDCDGFLGGDSDPIWLADAQDVPDIDGNGLPLTFSGYYETTANGVAFGPITSFNIFDVAYGCDEACFPTGVEIEWKGCENDGVSSTVGYVCDGGTGNLLNSIPLPTPLPYPAVNSFSNTYTFTGTGGGGCPGDYQIGVTVTVTGSFAQPAEDDIENAVPISVGGGSVTRAWCGNQSFQPGEPYGTSPGSAPIDIRNGSVWYKFIAPASGAIFITTDLANTDIGTRFIMYHAANGNYAGMNLCKTQFEYLSYTNYANTGGFLGTGSQADLEMDCGNLLAGSDGLIPGEVYYIQMSSDDPNVCGTIELEITDDGGSGRPMYDVPCGASLVVPNTTAVSESAGSPSTIYLDKGCTHDDEIDNNEVHAYPYDETLVNNNADASVWVKFVAPASGSVSIELNCSLSGEYFTLYRPDQCISPAVPGEYNCVDLAFDATDGDDGGIGSTAIRTFTCLEPGYTYYVMGDPDNINLCGGLDFWIYDPMLPHPANDVLCQATALPAYNVPVAAVGDIPTVVSGDNTNGCREDLAGEPPLGAAGSTVWYYFTAPASGVVDFTIQANTINNVSYALYPANTSGTNGCYGGTDGATGSTYTTSTLTDVPISAITNGSTTSTSAETICCLQPGAQYLIQIDGTTASSLGTFDISLQEQDVVVANSTITNTSNYVCYGDFIQITSGTSTMPSCMIDGIIVHDQGLTPTSTGIIGGTIYEVSTTGAHSLVLINDGMTSSIPSNTLVFGSVMVDGDGGAGVNYADLCPSMQVGPAQGFVFLTPITFSGLNVTECDVTLSLDGGLPQYDAAHGYDWEVSGPDATTAIVASGTELSYGTPLTFVAPAPGTYVITVSDTTLRSGGRCDYSVMITVDNTCYVCAPNAGSVVASESTILCPGQSVSFSTDGTESIPASGSYTYLLTDNTSTNIIKVLSSPTVINDGMLPSGTYCIHGLVTDASGYVIAPDSLLSTVSATCYALSSSCMTITLLDNITSTITLDCPAGTTGGSSISINSLNGGLPYPSSIDYLATLTGLDVFNVNISDGPIPIQAGDNANVWQYLNDGLYTITITDANNCSVDYEVLASNCAIEVLSVINLNLSGSTLETDNVLNWSLDNNQLVEKFEILRSKDGSDFQLIYTHTATNKANTETYQYKDINTAESYYYKIQYYTKDHTVKTSQIIYLSRLAEIDQAEINCIPNPTSGIATLQTHHIDAGSYIVEIYDMKGKIVHTQNAFLNSDVNNIMLDLNHLSSSIYFVKIANEKMLRTIKIVKQ